MGRMNSHPYYLYRGLMMSSVIGGGGGVNCRKLPVEMPIKHPASMKVDLNLIYKDKEFTYISFKLC